MTSASRYLSGSLLHRAVGDRRVSRMGDLDPVCRVGGRLLCESVADPQERPDRTAGEADRRRQRDGCAAQPPACDGCVTGAAA